MGQGQNTSLFGILLSFQNNYTVFGSVELCNVVLITVCISDSISCDLDIWPWPLRWKGYLHCSSHISVTTEQNVIKLFSRLLEPLDNKRFNQSFSVGTCVLTHWRPLSKITFSRISSQPLHIEVWFKITDLGFEGQRFCFCAHYVKFHHCQILKKWL